MKVGNAFTRSIFFPFCTLSLSLLQERRFHFAGCKRSHKVWQVIFIVFRNKCLHTNIRHRAFTETQNLGRFLLSDFMDYVQECFSVSAALIMFNNWIESNVHCEKEKRIVVPMVVFQNTILPQSFAEGPSVWLLSIFLCRKWFGRCGGCRRFSFLFSLEFFTRGSHLCDSQLFGRIQSKNAESWRIRKEFTWIHIEQG